MRKRKISKSSPAITCNPQVWLTFPLNLLHCHYLSCCHYKLKEQYPHTYLGELAKIALILYECVCSLTYDEPAPQRVIAPQAERFQDRPGSTMTLAMTTQLLKVRVWLGLAAEVKMWCVYCSSRLHSQRVYSAEMKAGVVWLREVQRKELAKFNLHFWGIHNENNWNQKFDWVKKKKRRW